MNPYRLLAFLAGLGLLAWILSATDLPALWALLKDFHWQFGIILLYYPVIFGLDTLGWRYAFRPEVRSWAPFLSYFRIRLAGEAVNYFTPTAWVGGEPVKAVVLEKRYGIPMADGMASVVIAKTTFAIAMLMFIIIGIAATAHTQPMSQELTRWVWVILPFLSLLMLLFMVIQFLKPFARVAALVEKVAPKFAAGLEEKMQSWDAAMSGLYKDSPGAIFQSFFYHLLGWFAGIVEIYLILYFLGEPVTWSKACFIEALWLLLRSGAFMIPASLGASEGFLILICSSLGIAAVPAVAIGLIRRGREVFWMGLGLLEFTYSYAGKKGVEGTSAE